MTEQYPDSQSEFARRQIEAWPLEDQDSARMIYYATDFRVGNGGSVDAALDQHLQRHHRYLGNITDGMERAAERGWWRPSKTVIEPFSVDDRAFFEIRDDGAKAIDLQLLGLPALESAEVSEGFVPIAVIAHERGEAVTSGIELVVANRDGQTSFFFLESMAAARGAEGVSRWVMPGELMLSGPNVRLKSQKMTSNKNGQILELSVTQIPEREGSARIIRSQPSTLEKAALAVCSEGFVRTPGRMARSAAALAAVAAIGVGVSPSMEDPYKNDEIKTANEMVLPAGTATYKGVRQAEALFSEDVLGRSRSAFAAYFNGDLQSLRRQAESYGFEQNWMNAEALERVRTAKDFRQLEFAFANAVGGLPVDLVIYDTSQSISVFGPKEKSGVEYRPATDLKLARQFATSFLDVLNNLDKQGLQEYMPPLEYGIVESVAPTDPTKLNPGGYYQSPGVTGKDQIIIETGQESTFADQVAAHEFFHYLDKAGRISSILNDLNPSNFAYLPKEVDYMSLMSSPTMQDGWNVVSKPYGNANSVEDGATIGGEIMLVRDSSALLQNSPLGEKMFGIIAKLESLHPGFTASFLQRFTAKHQPEASLGTKLKYEAKKRTDLLLGFATLLIIGAAYRPTRSHILERSIKGYGLSKYYKGASPKRAV